VVLNPDPNRIQIQTSYFEEFYHVLNQDTLRKMPKLQKKLPAHQRAFQNMKMINFFLFYEDCFGVTGPGIRIY
jgi:hypothetical protein